MRTRNSARWALAGLFATCFILVTTVVGATGPAPSIHLPDRVRQADDYYQGRQNLENVRKGVALLRQQVSDNPQDYEAWWRISKATCFLARHTDDDNEELKILDAAINAAKHAVALQPNRVEGHFWLGANLGLSAELRGMIEGLRHVDTIRNELETAVKLDPDYEQAAGLRTLARVYYRAPFFKGGDKRRSIDLLEQVLRQYPENSLTMLYLADSLWAVGRRVESRQMLERVLSLCPDPLNGPELADDQAEARERLAKDFRTGK
jgi:cytochrome c-type biogenesis protein CcmH/NrfG